MSGDSTASPASPPVLLDTTKIAEFVVHGYLRFDAVVPDDLNAAAITELERSFEGWRSLQSVAGGGPPTGRESDTPPGLAPFGTPLADAFEAASAFDRLLCLPVVDGAVRSLVGPDPVVLEHFAHVVRPGEGTTQPLHSDQPLGLDDGFAVILMWFASDVLPGAGGTRFVPGSHLIRRPNEELGRFRHVVGEETFTGSAGTVVLMHHGLWHAGSPNQSSTTRYMGKLRLGPTSPQVLRWDHSDLSDSGTTMAPDGGIVGRVRAALDAQPGTTPTDEGDRLAGCIASTLRGRFPWQDWSTHFADVVRRFEFFAALCGESDAADPPATWSYSLQPEERRPMGTPTARSRQQVLFLWLEGAGLQERVLAWAFYDGADGAGAVPRGDPPYPNGVEPLREGWRLVAAPQPDGLPADSSPVTGLRHQFMYERFVEVLLR